MPEKAKKQPHKILKNPNTKWTKYLNRHIIKQDIQMKNKHMRRCSAFFVIKELQNKTTMSYQTPVKMAQVQNKRTIPNTGKGVEQRRTILTRYQWRCQMISHFGRQFEQFYTKLNVVLPYNPNNGKCMSTKNLHGFFCYCFLFVFYHSLIHNLQQLEPAKVLFNR